MEIGWAPPVSGSWATLANIARVARRAEELGYRTLWTFQRVLFTEERAMQPAYASVLDPLITLGTLAGLTDRIRLGVAVVNAPFYAPVILAGQLTTLDVLSGGRLTAGLGLGWSPDEFAAVGVPLRDRGRRLDEFVRCIDTIWTQQVVEFEGDFYRIPSSHIDPKPVQRPRPPMLLGGMAEPALRRAGRLADGWISSSRADFEQIRAGIAIVREAATQAGRDPDALQVVCRGVVRLRPAGDPEARLLTGPLERIREDLERLSSLGVTETFVDLNFDEEVGSPDVDPAEAMRRGGELLEALAPGA